MVTIFTAGSMNIKRLDPAFVERLAKIVSSNLNVVVGDADGADTSIQQVLHELNASSVAVYCSGPTPRNNVGDWPVHPIFSAAEKGTRAYFTAKDLEMANVADYGLMMWDANSTGTLSNVIELVRRRKTCVVFVNKHKKFVTVSDAKGLHQLVELMSDKARVKAESKIKLQSKIQSIASEQFSLTLEDVGSKKRDSIDEKPYVAAACPEQPLNKEDWRFFAIDKFGTGSASIATLERLSERNVVGFGLPSAPALFISMAFSAYRTRTLVNVSELFDNHPHSQGTYPDDHTPLFNYFEAVIAEVVCSHSAIEAAVNEMIPEAFVYHRSRKSGQEAVSMTRHEIERAVSLDEKLKKVLPQALNIANPAGGNLWPAYQELQDLRDRLIHLKSVDRKSSGVEEDTIWGRLLRIGPTAFPYVALDMIAHFYNPDRRWFRLRSKTPSSASSISPEIDSLNVDAEGGELKRVE
jgi:hypothetical protein